MKLSKNTNNEIKTPELNSNNEIKIVETIEMDEKELKIQTFNAYLAGFIDGDGSINCQITADKTIKRQYKIVPSITIFQKAEKKIFFEQIQKELENVGYIRERKDGIVEYCIKSKPSIRIVIKAIKPYLRFKAEQAKLIIKVLDLLEQVKTDSEFLKVCKEVDKFGVLNYSKKRTNTTEVIKNKLSSPVET